MKLFKKKHADTPAYPWRLFTIYSLTGIVASLSILPYLLTLVSMGGNSLPVTLEQIIVEQLLQSAIILIPAVGIGLLLARRVKLHSPYLHAVAYGKKVPAGFRRVAMLSLGLGFLVSIGVSIVDLALIRDEVMSNVTQVNAIPVAWRFLTSFYGAIDEEILMRLFFMTLAAWIAWTIRKNGKGEVTVAGMWIAIVVSAILFGMSHLPVTSALTAVDTTVVIRALILNGIGGAVYGWLYWKKGFEAAMMSHFASDITLQIIVPAVLGALATQ